METEKRREIYRFQTEARVVTQLVCGNYLDEYQNRSSRARRPLWKEAAINYPELADKINRLKVILEEARRRREQHGRSDFSFPIFEQVRDQIARKLLYDIATVRENDDSSVRNESRNMLRELHTRRKLEKITTPYLIEAILANKLQLDSKTHSEQTPVEN